MFIHKDDFLLRINCLLVRTMLFIYFFLSFASHSPWHIINDQDSFNDNI